MNLFERYWRGYDDAFYFPPIIKEQALTSPYHWIKYEGILVSKNYELELYLLETQSCLYNIAEGFKCSDMVSLSEFATAINNAKKGICSIYARPEFADDRLIYISSKLTNKKLYTVGDSLPMQQLLTMVNTQEVYSSSSNFSAMYLTTDDIFLNYSDGFLLIANYELDAYRKRINDYSRVLVV